MEVQEEVMTGSSLDQASYVLKGKRTKRQRPMSPFVLTMATTSSYSSAEGSLSGGGGGGGDSGYNFSGVDRVTTSPSSNSGEFTQSIIDEEDMANCLILLAQGRSQKSSESVLAVTNKVAGAELYQCKTCNRCFPSFQALGGHRASHKKPKVATEEKKPVVSGRRQENLKLNDDNTTLSLQIPSRDLSSPTNNKSRVHECSICGAEFNSGQALGGHMRRHRPMPTVATTGSHHEDSQEVKKPRTLLSLDLNLPAPEDDLHRESTSPFPFASKEQVIVFSASPLVDCHY